MKLPRRLYRYLDLPPGDRRMFRHAWLLLLRYRLLLMVSSREQVGRRVAKAMSPAAPGRVSDAGRAEHGMVIAHQAARNHLLSMNCLVRAFAGRELLARDGIETRLRIGVRREDTGALKAHAWLEAGGEVVGDTGDVASRFVPFDDPSQMAAVPRRWD